MRAKHKKDKQINECRVYEDFGQFTADRNFVDRKIGLSLSSFDNKGIVMEIETPCGRLRACKGDVVIKYPNGSLTVLKRGLFDDLYVESTAELDIQEEIETRQRICQMLLDTMKSKGISTFNKLEQLIKRYAKSEKTVETDSEAGV